MRLILLLCALLCCCYGAALPACNLCDTSAAEPPQPSAHVNTLIVGGGASGTYAAYILSAKLGAQVALIGAPNSAPQRPLTVHALLSKRGCILTCGVTYMIIKITQFTKADHR